MSTAAGKHKISLDPAKETWHPSVLPGQVVLVSTIDPSGEPNFAPKSWITMAAFAGPVLAFGCNRGHCTCQNVMAQGEFVVNIPDASLAERIWELADWHGAERRTRSGLTLRPATQVAPPLIEECRAHLECRLDSVKYFGNEVLIFGRIVALSIDSDCLGAEPADQYCALRPLFFLEDGLYGVIDSARLVGGETPIARQPLFVVEIGAPKDHADLRDLHVAHAAFLQRLRASRHLLLAGTAESSGDGPAPAPAGVSALYVVSAPDRAAAEGLVAADPLLNAGGTCSIRPWARTF